MAIKAKELARLLGVSPATVSLVLNGKPGICEGTRQQLTRQIRDLGYGYMLCGEEHCAQGKAVSYVVYPGESHVFSLAVLEGAQEVAQEAGYTLSLIHVGKGDRALSGCLRRGETLGLLVQKACLEDRDMEELEALGVPYVMVDTDRADRDVNCVSVNSRQGFCKLVDYLAGMGHRALGYLFCRRGCTSAAERRENFYRAMAHFGLPVEPDYCIALECPKQDISRRMEQLLAQGMPLPTAFLAEDDRVACQAMKAFARCGYRVPEDISVVGFGDSELCTMVSPELTTVRVPYRTLGREAMSLLLQKLRGGTEDGPLCTRLEVGVELVVRGSVKARQ